VNNISIGTASNNIDITVRNLRHHGSYQNFLKTLDYLLVKNITGDFKKSLKSFILSRRFFKFFNRKWHNVARYQKALKFIEDCRDFIRKKCDSEEKIINNIDVDELPQSWLFRWYSKIAIFASINNLKNHIAQLQKDMKKYEK
jgi:hypothetical protein